MNAKIVILNAIKNILNITKVTIKIRMKFGKKNIQTIILNGKRRIKNW